MEEDKAAAYYDELSRKGGGAARFKQGLGFSASAASGSVPERGSALPSSSFLSNFVRASSPTQASKFEKQAQLQSVQNKLKKKPDEKVSRASERSGRESSHRHRSRSRERDRERERHSRKRSRSRERDIDRYGGRERDSDRRRRRSRSASPRRERRSERSRGKSVSPQERRRTASSGGGERNGERKLAKNRNVDYPRLIDGYDKMTPAERVKAKMKFQLAETAEKDEIKGSGWERFEFDKDAPLDDEEIEAAEDDVALVKRIGQSFRFSAVEARREDQVRDAHDAAMFGVPVRPMSTTTSDSEPEVQPNKKEENESGPVTNLISEKVLAKQQGSWRDRARKV